MALTGSRQMMVEANEMNLTYQDDGRWGFADDEQGNWEYTKYLDYHFFFYTQKISLEMLFQEKLSLQLEGVAMQKGYDPVLLYSDAGGTKYTPSGRINLQYYVSTTPPWVDNQGKNAWMFNEATGKTNTFGDSSKYFQGLPFQQCQIASNTTYTVNSNVGLSSRGWLSVLNKQMFGSNTAIAGKQLYVTLCWIIEDETAAGQLPAASGIAYFPPLRLVMGGEIYKPSKGAWNKDLLRNTNIEPKLR